MTVRRRDVVELAVLGLLHDTPMHGYELRKQLTGVLAGAGLISYGSLYPALRRLGEAGLITERADVDASGVRPSRGKVVYELTAEGKEHFQTLLADAGPDAWDDERFGVRLAFFRHTDAHVRLRILEGRRTRLEERLASLRGSITRASTRLDEWSSALHRYGLDGVEREVRWLDELIADERTQQRPAPQTSARTHPINPDDTASSGLAHQ